MPFIAKKDGELVTAHEVGERFNKNADFKCPSCDSTMAYKKSHRRGNLQIRGHFYHLHDEACSYGESDKHQAMKAAAVRKLRDKYDMYDTIEVEEKIGGHIADVVLKNKNNKYKEGIVVEVQHRNKNKDIIETTKDYILHGYSVHWVFNTEEGYKMLGKCKSELNELARDSIYVGDYTKEEGINLGNEIYRDNFDIRPVNYCCDCSRPVKIKKHYGGSERCKECGNTRLEEVPMVPKSDYWTITDRGKISHKFLDIGLYIGGLTQNIRSKWEILITWVNHLGKIEKEIHVDDENVAEELSEIINNIDSNHEIGEFSSFANGLPDNMQDEIKDEPDYGNELYCTYCSEYLPHYRGTPDEWIRNHVDFARKLTEHPDVSREIPKFDTDRYSMDDDIDDVCLICPHCISEINTEFWMDHMQIEHNYTEDDADALFHRLYFSVTLYS